jgi:hypothetical protein
MRAQYLREQVVNKSLGDVSGAVVALATGAAALVPELPEKLDGVPIDAKLNGGLRYGNFYHD